MKSFVPALVLSALALGFAPPPAKADEVKIDPEKFGAIAYSPKTGKYGLAWNFGTREDAQKGALNEVKEDDAKAVTWVKYGWAVLVITSDNAYGYDTAYGDGATEGDAIEKAIKQLRKYSEARITTIVVVCSGDLKPRTINLSAGSK